MRQLDWHRIEQVLAAALDLPENDRPALLQQLCGDNAELCAEVRSLLAAHRNATSFLRVRTQLSLDSARDQCLGDNGASTLPPANVGKYRIIGLLGKGGMGVVYEAEQELPRRRVALKVVQGGVVSPTLLRRFEQESYALGQLQHPGIAQIYEAGTFDGGLGPQPYLAMELVRGTPLQQYADANQLNTHERLELVTKVCDAVHHAHKRGIIHRDLKPGNILVDEGGQPKIVDFGIARATNREAIATGHTDTGQLVGTLAYMSPEQLADDPPAIDIRSDVYALGVILFELLTGRLPYAVGDLPHQAIHAIRDEDPAALGSVSREYRGDIETIVGKALEKDRARRYASAEDLASDIQRYLRNEPIVARRPTATYQLQKFVRRHRAVAIGLAAVFLVLSAGIVTSTLEAARARRAEQAALRQRDRAAAAERVADRERDRALDAEHAATREQDRARMAESAATAARNQATAAETQAVRQRNRALTERQRADTESASATAINEFLQNDLLAQASASAQARPLTKPDPDLKIRTALDRAAGRLPGRFDHRPLVEASIRETIGETYRDLGLYSEAQRHVERALDLRRVVLGQDNRETLASMNMLALLHQDQGRYAQAEPLFEKVLQIRRRVLGEDHQDTLVSMNGLARMYEHQGKYAQAEVLFTDVVGRDRRVLGDEHPDTLKTMNNLASLCLRQGRYARAESLFTQVLETQRRLMGEDHPDTLTMMNNLVVVYSAQGQAARAERLCAEVLEARRRVLGIEHPDTLRSAANLAMLYRDEGKSLQAEPLALQVVETRRRVLGEDHPETLIGMSNLATVYVDQGKYRLAESLFARLVETQRRVVGEDHPDTLISMNNLTMVYLAEGKQAQAEPLNLHIIETRRRVLGEDHPSTLISLNTRALIYRALGRQAEAEALFLQLVERRRRVLGAEHPGTLTSMNGLAELYLSQSRYAEAEPIYTKILELRRRTLGPEHPDTTDVLVSLARVRFGQQKYAEAESLAREALSNRERKDPDAWRSYEGQVLLAASLAGQARFAEAEALMVAGYRGLIRQRDTIPWESQSVVEQAGEWIVGLYTDWGQPAKAAEWRHELQRAWAER